jgi:AcrR family transcriptional regulator
MAKPVKRPYDNSRRLAQVRATRLSVIEAAKALFIEQGYPGTTLESVADAADVPLPTLYRLFGSKRALLTAVLETAFVGDDEPVAFVDRPAVQAALSQSDPSELLAAFAAIARDFMERSSAILHVLATAAQVDAEAADLMAEIRRQQHGPDEDRGRAHRARRSRSEPRSVRGCRFRLPTLVAGHPPDLDRRARLGPRAVRNVVVPCHAPNAPPLMDAGLVPDPLDNAGLGRPGRGRSKAPDS